MLWVFCALGGNTIQVIFFESVSLGLGDTMFK